MEELELHRLGWKAFQDLCVAIVEERTSKPVQTFLPTNDAGRDGAFLGRLDSADQKGNSTIQCKFTSKPTLNLTLSMLRDELPKVKRLARKKLAGDYIILTNHTITGAADRAALAAYCQGYGRWVEAEQKLRETPALLKMPSGYVQQNPWLTIASKQLELMHKYMSNFGLSPSSRTRVEVFVRVIPANLLASSVGSPGIDTTMTTKRGSRDW